MRIVFGIIGGITLSCGVASWTFGGLVLFAPIDVRSKYETLREWGVEHEEARSTAYESAITGAIVSKSLALAAVALGGVLSSLGACVFLLLRIDRKLD